MCPVFLFLLSCGVVRGQSPGVAVDTAAAFDINGACEAVIDDERSGELFEHLAWLLDHPLDLNSVGEEDLRRVPGISSGDAALLLLLRARAGRFARVDQLLRYGPDGVRVYHALAPFVHVKRGDGTSARLRSRAGWRPARSAHDSTNGGAGFREYHRLDVSSGGNVTGGVTIVRDAGERYADAFFSGSFGFLFEGAPVEQVILGDFAVGCAHGLVFGQGSGGLGEVPGNIPRSGGLRMEPFHGSSGTRLLRGAGAARSVRFRTGVLSLAGFVARTPFSASLDDAGYVLSYDVESDFSKPGSLVRRNAVHEWASGFRAAWISSAGLSCGTTLFIRHLSDPFPDGTVFGKVTDARVLGCDASLVAGAAEFSAEGVWMKEGFGLSGRIGIMPVPEVRFTVAAWDFSPGYRSGKSGTGTGGGETTNEEGALLGWQIELWRKITCTGHLSHYRKPWRTYFDRMPPAGTEAIVTVAVPLSSMLTLSGRVATVTAESWEQEHTAGRIPETSMERTFRRGIRFGLVCNVTRALRLQTRVEHITATAFGPPRMEHGWAIFQEAHAALSRTLTLDLRWTSVQTDSYVSRTYAIERDVDGAFAGTSVYGTGMRWYLLLRYAYGPGMALSGKFTYAARSTGPFVSAVDRSLTLQLDVATSTSGRER